ncbi:putative short chain dehydrogenase protein [Podospora aff. communis PSN243]|uniref:Short chain dehydrogenase protein n=1 Tax=Podospora aff. communis PSN243 TaxID=3040156 RepID=A0AAV9G4K9_9PEZI|nr:putative short chain dehydrogenase protein [Podospora aff. communis PSN243]
MAYFTPFTLPGIIICAVVYTLIDFVLPYLRPSTLHRYLHSKDGKPAWALVTGASDGIGKALSFELASRGFNVVIHGRNPAKLERVQRELQAAHPNRSFRILIADATQCAPDTFKDIAHRLSDIHLTVLVNNAGGTPISSENLFKTMDEYSHKEIADTIALNATFPTMLWNALIPSLSRSTPALILVVGSLASSGLPLVAPYGSSKSYLRTLSEALAQEMIITKRDIEVLHVGLGTVTGVSGIWTPPSFFVPHATTMAREILGRVGCGRVDVVPYWPQALQIAGTVVLPRWVKGMVFRKVMVELRDKGLNPGEERKRE